MLFPESDYYQIKLIYLFADLVNFLTQSHLRKVDKEYLGK